MDLAARTGFTKTYVILIPPFAVFTTAISPSKLITNKFPSPLRYIVLYTESGNPSGRILNFPETLAALVPSGI